MEHKVIKFLKLERKECSKYKFWYNSPFDDIFSHVQFCHMLNSKTSKAVVYQDSTSFSEKIYLIFSNILNLLIAQLCSKESILWWKHLVVRRQGKSADRYITIGCIPLPANMSGRKTEISQAWNENDPS